MMPQKKPFRIFNYDDLFVPLQNGIPGARLFPFVDNKTQ